MHLGHVSTFSPTACGIATYAESLIDNLPDAKHSKLRLLYHCDSRAPDDVLEIKIEDKNSYSAAVSTINQSSMDLISLQHEFAIFGGKDGEYIIDFVSEIKKPIVTTLHTTPTLVNDNQRRILRVLADRSAAIVVLTEEAKTNVKNVIEDANKLFVIRHGVPQISFKAPAQMALRQKWNREHVFMSAGHVSDRKGYTNTLAALARLREFTSDFLYVIIGTYQPQFGTTSQCVYSLKRMIRDYGLDDHVQFDERYVDLSFLLEHILASDVGIVAYTDCQQSSSGMIPMLLACGRPVIATPFEYVQSTSKMVPGLHMCKGYQSDDILEVFHSILTRKHSVLESMPHIYAVTRA
jgi:glycosyltransferase involved in cell wall biosynthesis